MNHDITIIATLHAQEGKTDATAACLHKMVRETVKEAGCIAYDLHQASDDPREFILVEYWRDAAAIELHDASAHMATLKAELPLLLDQPVVVRKLMPLPAQD
jgi:quinol monooxygenase YgiN